VGWVGGVFGREDDRNAHRKKTLPDSDVTPNRQLTKYEIQTFGVQQKRDEYLI